MSSCLIPLAWDQKKLKLNASFDSALFYPCMYRFYISPTESFHSKGVEIECLSTSEVLSLTVWSRPQDQHMQ